MPDGHLLRFGPYQLDPQQEQFWCDSQPVRLPPKVFQVLRYLAERPGQLVTKEELFRVVWADTVVGDAALTMCIQEIRKALADNAREPHYIETMHRRGFRFIGEVVSSQYPALSGQEEATQPADNSSLTSSAQRLALEEQSLIVTGQTLDPRASDLRPQTPDTLTSPAPVRFTRSVVLAAVLLLVATILLVQYLSRSSLSPQPS